MGSTLPCTSAHPLVSATLSPDLDRWSPEALGQASSPKLASRPTPIACLLQGLNYSTVPYWDFKTPSTSRRRITQLGLQLNTRQHSSASSSASSHNGTPQRERIEPNTTIGPTTTRAATAIRGPRFLPLLPTIAPPLAWSPASLLRGSSKKPTTPGV